MKKAGAAANMSYQQSGSTEQRNQTNIKTGKIDYYQGTECITKIENEGTREINSPAQQA